MTGGLVAVRFGSGPAELCSLATDTMDHPRFRGANATYTGPFMPPSRPWKRPSGPLPSGSGALDRASERLLPASGPWKVKPARKVVGRGTRRRVAQHAVRKPASQVGTGSIWFRQNSGQSPDGAKGSRSQSPMVQRRYSPITHASEPEKTVPTYAGSWPVSASRPTPASPRRGGSETPRRCAAPAGHPLVCGRRTLRL